MTTMDAAQAGCTDERMVKAVLTGNLPGNTCSVDEGLTRGGGKKGETRRKTQESDDGGKEEEEEKIVDNGVRRSRRISMRETK